MQRDCPQAGWGNSGYQARSLGDPATQFGNSLTIVEPTAEKAAAAAAAATGAKKTCRAPSPLSGVLFFSIGDTDDDNDDGEHPGIEQGGVTPSRGTGSVAGARAEPSTTSTNVETSTCEKKLNLTNDSQSGSVCNKRSDTASHDAAISACGKGKRVERLSPSAIFPQSVLVIKLQHTATTKTCPCI